MCVCVCVCVCVLLSPEVGHSVLCAFERAGVEGSSVSLNGRLELSLIIQSISLQL